MLTVVLLPLESCTATFCEVTISMQKPVPQGKTGHWNAVPPGPMRETRWLVVTNRSPGSLCRHTELAFWVRPSMLMDAFEGSHG